MSCFKDAPCDTTIYKRETFNLSLTHNQIKDSFGTFEHPGGFLSGAGCRYGRKFSGFSCHSTYSFLLPGASCSAMFLSRSLVLATIRMPSMYFSNLLMLKSLPLSVEITTCRQDRPRTSEDIFPERGNSAESGYLTEKC